MPPKPLRRSVSLAARVSGCYLPSCTSQVMYLFYGSCIFQVKYPSSFFTVQLDVEYYLDAIQTALSPFSFSYLVILTAKLARQDAIDLI